MTRRKWIVPLLAVAGVALASPMLMPPVLALFENDTEAPPAPDVASTVRVSEARVVLPPVAGGPARVFLSIENTGPNSTHLTGIEIEHATAVTILDTDTPDALAVSPLPIEPSAKLEFAPGGRFQIAARYDDEMVPGRTVQVELTFDTGRTLTVGAIVEAGTARNGAERRLPAEPAAEEGRAEEP